MSKTVWTSETTAIDSERKHHVHGTTAKAALFAGLAIIPAMNYGADHETIISSKAGYEIEWMERSDSDIYDSIRVPLNNQGILDVLKAKADTCIIHVHLVLKGAVIGEVLLSEDTLHNENDIFWLA